MKNKPYEIMTSTDIREILNRRASGEQELMDAILEVDPASLYYHTHSYYQQEKYHHDHHPNDFATWASQQVRDRVLGERLSVIDLHTLGNVEALRTELATVIEAHLDVMGYSPRALLGDPFEFVKSHSVIIPSGITVRTLEELGKVFRTMQTESLYYHFFKDAFGRGKRVGTLVEWAAEQDASAGERLASVNPYKLHMDRLREELVGALGKEKV